MNIGYLQRFTLKMKHPWTRENGYLVRSYKILIKDGYLISSDKILTKDGYLVRSYKMNGYLVRFLPVRSG